MYYRIVRRQSCRQRINEKKKQKQQKKPRNDWPLV